MKRYGCHHCGRKPLAGETFVADHMPVTALNRRMALQQLYPQCPQCSSKPGGETAKHLAAGTYPPGC